MPSHTYQFNWSPNQSWSSLYPPAPEIHQYLEDVTDQHDLRRFMKFNTECILAEWDEESSKWKVVLRDVVSNEWKTVIADVFVYAVGRLNNYKIPEIEGQEDFSGRKVHTANWPADIDVTGKRVPVIGNGASAVQCVAALQPGEWQHRIASCHEAHNVCLSSCFRDNQHCSWTNLDSSACVLCRWCNTTPM